MTRFDELNKYLTDDLATGPDKIAFELYGTVGAAVKLPTKVALGYWVGNDKNRVFVERGQQVLLNKEHWSDPKYELASWQDALTGALEKDAQDTK